MKIALLNLEEQFENKVRASIRRNDNVEIIQRDTLTAPPDVDVNVVHTLPVESNYGDAFLLGVHFGNEPPHTNVDLLIDWVSLEACESEIRFRLDALVEEKQRTTEEFSVGPYRFIPDQESITLHGVPCVLTRKDYCLAAYLFKNANKLHSRSQLLSTVWGVDGVDTRTVDVHISRIRKALHLGSETGYEVKSVSRAGYIVTRSSFCSEISHGR